MTAAIQPVYPFPVASLPAPISPLHLSIPRPTAHANRVSLFVFYPPKADLALFFTVSYSVSFCLFALFSQPTFFVFNTFWPLLQKHGGGGYPRSYLNPIDRAPIAFRGLALPDLANSFIVGVSFPSKMRGVRFCRSKRPTRREKENSRHPVWCRSHRRVHREADAREAGH